MTESIPRVYFVFLTLSIWNYLIQNLLQYVHPAQSIQLERAALPSTWRGTFRSGQFVGWLMLNLTRTASLEESQHFSLLCITNYWLLTPDCSPLIIFVSSLKYLSQTISNYLTKNVLPVLKDRHDEFLLRELVKRGENHKVIILCRYKWQTWRRSK